MFKGLIVVSLFWINFTVSAHASFWVECRVVASVQLVEAPSIYEIVPHKAHVSGGYDKIGSDCGLVVLGEPMTYDGRYVEPLKIGSNVLLKYYFDNSDGPDGEVSSDFGWTNW